MKYFFGYFGFLMLASAFFASFMNPLHGIILGSIILLSAVCIRFFSINYRDHSAILLAVSAGIIAVSVAVISDIYPAKYLDGMSTTITGTVVDVSATGGNPQFTIKTDSVGIEGAPQKIKLILSGWDENSAKPYDKISCEVSFITYNDEDTFSVLKNRARKISVYAYSKSPLEVIGNERNSVGYGAHLIREKISGIIYSYFIDWHAPFMEQILIGTRGDLDYGITRTFRQSGMSHILAVSGMHIAVIMKLFEALFLYRRIEGVLKKAEIAILILIVLVYMSICGFGMSVIRAGGLFITYYLVRFFLYGSKTLDNLGIAIVAVLIIDPLASCDAGFIMSAVSCGAISAFYPSLSCFLKKPFKNRSLNPAVKYVIDAFSVSLIGSVSVLPVSAAVFGEIYPAGIFANTVVSVLIAPIIVLGFITVLLGFIPVINFLSGGTAAICMILNGFLYKIANFFAFEGDFMFSAESPWVLLWIFGSAVLIIVPAAVSCSSKYVLHSIAVSFSVLLGGVLINFLLFSGTARAEVFALEHGTAISCSKDGDSVLVLHNLGDSDEFYADFGSSYDVIISLDALSGFYEATLAENSKASFAYLSSEDAVSRCENASFAEEGRIFFGDGLYVDIISDGVFCIDGKEISLLYISEECDIMDIEPKFRKADIIVLDGVSPSDYTVLRCEYMILRKMEGFYSGAYETMVLKKDSAVFFGYNDNIKKGWLSR